jgi:release factor glutamine methyltransferase
VTVLEVIHRSTEFLARKGVDSPRLQSELLLAHVLGLRRLDLYLKFDRVLSEAELESIRALIKRRGEREPLQHILGTACFCGLDFKVNRHVLVPRPETEILAERALTFLIAQKGAPANILDFGTGSGCLAVYLAVKAPTANVTAIDASAAALEVARVNAATHGVANRLEFVCGDGFAALPAGARFDLIVTNPPYIPSGDIAALQPEVRDFDPRPALDGGPDGLDFYRRLAREGRVFLRPGGKLMAEFGDGQAPPIRALFEEQGWRVEAIENDLAGKPRVLVAAGPTP